MRVFVTRVIAPEGLQLLTNAGLEVTIWEERRGLTEKELVDNCLKHDALLSVGSNKN